jgi:DNA repair protein RAD16
MSSVAGLRDELDEPSMSTPLTASMLEKAESETKSKVMRTYGATRTSLSSTSTIADSAESSGYSTPLTSAVNTPAEVKQEVKQETGQRRTRLGAILPTPSTTLSAEATAAFQRANALRNSEFSLSFGTTKRKRAQSEAEEEDEEDDDDSPDAQLARAMQQEEDAKAGDMQMDGTPSSAIRRATGTMGTVASIFGTLTEIGASNEEDDDDDDGVPLYARRRQTVGTKRARNRTKASKQGAKRTKLVVADSDESEFKDSDSDALSDPPSDLSDAADWFAPTTKKKRARAAATRSSRTTSRMSGAVDLPGDGDMDGVLDTLDEYEQMDEVDRYYSTLPSDHDFSDDENRASEYYDSDGPLRDIPRAVRDAMRYRSRHAGARLRGRAERERSRLEAHHPELLTMWTDLEKLGAVRGVQASQPKNITRQLKPFQLEGLSWMQEMEKTDWGGGLLGDEMGMGKTIQAVSLIMSDYPAKNPSLVLIPPVALMQWQQEIGDYTDGTLKTFVFHGTNKNTKDISAADLKKYDVILMSYNSLESMYRHQEKGFKRKHEMHFQKSVIHQLQFHRVILDEAHNIKTRTTGVAKACFALKADHKWCLSGTPLQNRIGEFFSLVRFLNIKPFSCYFCKQCPCSTMEWSMNSNNRCTGCNHSGMQHVSVFNQELLNPIQKFGNKGPGKVAFQKLRLLTDRFMLRRVKRDHSSAMELPAKEIKVDRQFWGEEENDFAMSIMHNTKRKFETYVSQGVLLNNYANIFGLIMQMRQVADHPDLILKKDAAGGQNVLVCCICDEPAEEPIRSMCRHDFCRSCVKNYLRSSDDVDVEPDCPRCHIPLSIDLEQPAMEQDEERVKKSSIINRIKMENWTSSTKIEALVHQLYRLRSSNKSSKSIIFSQFTTMVSRQLYPSLFPFPLLELELELRGRYDETNASSQQLQLVEWRLRRAGITTVMLDGSMTPSQRQASITHFMTTPTVECFLVSLKAGGVALNLTEASEVFIIDPWWNPAAEWQSADRCHRIGQCRPCRITRLCVEDSVESRMVLLQEKKANMIRSTINSDSAAMESLTAEDMQFLFRGN